MKPPSSKYVVTPNPETEDSAVDENGTEGPENEAGSSDEAMEDATEGSDSGSESAPAEEDTSRNRKRKRAAADDIEESYMRRVAKDVRDEEQKQKSEKAKRQKVDSEQDSDSDDGSAGSGEDASDKENEDVSQPVHESVAGDAREKEVEKSNRTIFLGNVSTEAIKSKSSKKTLMQHLGSFLSTLPESTGPHKVESIRFRSTPFTSGGHIPKRAAFARKDILDDTTPSTNAYAVYSSAQAARKAPGMLNGTVVLDRHVRVDSVAHPSATDHRRCVFVGNLDFMDQEPSGEDEEGQKRKKNPKVSDVEEGLWRTFDASTGGSEKGKTTKVESVRVIRDRATRVGKGFAYVQFYDQNSVEEALLLDGKKFPPMLPRKLRVVRAKKPKKTSEAPKAPVRGQKLGEAQKTLHGRAGKLLGKAGAAKVKAGVNAPNPQGMIFEGHRATEGGSSKIKVKTKSRGLKGKPKSRSTKRAAAYRAGGGKKEKAGK